MDALERLDEYLVQVIDAPMDAEEKQEFRIETKDQAIWALRKIAAIERSRKEAREAASIEIERIQAWLAEEEKRADQARKYLDYLLEEYHRRQLAENPKQKTIKLPHGILQFRAQQPEFQRDDNIIKAWAKENRPDVLVPQDPKLDWASLKKQLWVDGDKMVDPESGEVVPGIEVIEREPKFSIKLEGM